MGLLVPWARCQREWYEIQKYRQDGRGLADKPHHDNISVSPRVSSRVSWIPRELSSKLGLMTTKLYSDQRDSPLAKLPKEIRLQIWAHAIGEQHVTIVRKVNKLVHAILPRDGSRMLKADSVSVPKQWIGPTGYELRFKPHTVISTRSLLPLLMTCKQVYLEAIELLYSQNSFEFTTIEAFYRFLFLTPATNLHLIRSIKLRWPGFSYWTHFREDDTSESMYEYDISWQEICREVVALKSLRSFSIVAVGNIQVENRTIEGISFERIYKIIREICLPLTGLPDRVDFEFAIRWSDKNKTLGERLRTVHKDGCKNLRIVEVGSGDISRNHYTNYPYDEW